MNWIIIKNEFVGFHKWGKAPKEVYFLKNYHRHIFNVISYLEVKKLDRELEFFIVKKEINKYLKKYKDCYFMESCETIATKLKLFLEKKFKVKVKVSVFEDNENGSLIE